jgi:asparagine synthase (glutamine-hydrolysing)
MERPWHRPTVETGIAWARVSPAADWASTFAARDLAERLRALVSGGVPDLTADDVALRAVRWHGKLTRNTQRLAASWGVRLRAPFLDDAVVAACASVPVVDRTTVYTAKPLLGLTLSGQVPDEVLTRRSNCDYTASEYASLRAAAPRIQRLLTDPLLADLGLIGPDRIASAVHDAIDGRAASVGALAEVIATELWLRATQNTDLSFWTTPGALR